MALFPYISYIGKFPLQEKKGGKTLWDLPVESMAVSLF